MAKIGDDCMFSLIREIQETERKRNWSTVPPEFVLDAVRRVKESIRPWFRGLGNNKIKARVKLAEANSFNELKQAVRILNT